MRETIKTRIGNDTVFACRYIRVPIRYTVYTGIASALRTVCEIRTDGTCPRRNTIRRAGVQAVQHTVARKCARCTVPYYHRSFGLSDHCVVAAAATETKYLCFATRYRDSCVDDVRVMANIGNYRTTTTAISIVIQSMFVRTRVRRWPIYVYIHIYYIYIVTIHGLGGREHEKTTTEKEKSVDRFPR